MKANYISEKGNGIYENISKKNALTLYVMSISKSA